MTDESAANATTFGGASARGASHIQRNKPNQDAHGGWRSGQWSIVAVSDGHGGMPYFRSERGSRFAVEAVRDAFVALIGGGSASPADRDRLDGQFASLPAQIVARWRAAVTADIKSDPDPRLLTGDPHIVYGATCIAAAFGPGVSIFAQLGDGDLLAGSSGEDLTKPLPDDEGLEGEQTYSLCLPDAPEHFRMKLFVAPHPLAAADFAMASSDGLSKSFAGDAQFFDVARHWRSLVAQNGIESACADLESWLARCSQRGSGDDITLMFYRAGVVGSGLAGASQQSCGDARAARRLAPSTKATVRTGYGFGIVALATLLGAAVGAGGVYYLTKSRATEPPRIRAQDPVISLPANSPTAPLPNVSPATQPLEPAQNKPAQPVELSEPAKGPSQPNLPVPPAPAMPVVPPGAAEK